MAQSDTETALVRFRSGQRLRAGLLQISGFSSIDPQCPLGGPDGLKDVICEINAWKYIGGGHISPFNRNEK